MPLRIPRGFLTRPLSTWNPRLTPIPTTPVPLLPRTPTRSASQWPSRPYQRPRYQRFSNTQKLYNLWNTSPGFRYGVGAFGVGGGIFYYTNLERVPVSGRLRFNCVPESFLEKRGQDGFQMFMQEYGSKVLPPNHPNSRLVNMVLQRLVPASGLGGLNWEVRVIDDPAQKNAFVLPGGKVFVFSGILPICGGDDGLAAVLGHEIAHQVARHGGEQLSGLGILVALAAFASYQFDVSGQLAYLMLDFILSKPGSRKMESEADYIGLLMMAEACYDPNAAVGLWQRMAKAEQFAPPQFLSTHPTSKNRITAIQGWLPQAEDKRAQSECGNTIAFAPGFRRALGYDIF